MDTATKWEHKGSNNEMEHKESKSEQQNMDMEKQTIARNTKEPRSEVTKKCKVKPATWIKPVGGHAAKWARKTSKNEVKQRKLKIKRERLTRRTASRLKSPEANKRSEKGCNVKPAKWIKPARGRDAKSERKCPNHDLKQKNGKTNRRIRLQRHSSSLEKSKGQGEKWERM